MRKGLRNPDKEWHTYTAKIERFSSKRKNGNNMKTMLVTNTRDRDENNKIVTEHLWLTLGKKFENLNLKEGDLIQFDALASTYENSFVGYKVVASKINVKLLFLMNVKKISLD